MDSYYNDFHFFNLLLARIKTKNDLMKKIKVFAFTFLLSIASFASVENIDPAIRVQQLESRVQEIWKMDHSDMEKVEKVALKEEIKEIRKELKSSGLDSKVSISVGAIIIILLLLILL
jgi:uncharacterized protein (UPF0335 family)